MVRLLMEYELRLLYQSQKKGYLVLKSAMGLLSFLYDGLGGNSTYLQTYELGISVKKGH